MDSQRFRLADAERQRRLDELTTGPATLDRELGVARLLLEESLRVGNAGLAANLCKILGSLVKEHVANEIRMRRLISVDELREYATFMAASMCEHLRHVPDHETIVDEIAADFRLGLQRLQQPVIDHTLIEGPHE